MNFLARNIFMTLHDNIFYWFYNFSHQSAIIDVLIVFFSEMFSIMVAFFGVVSFLYLFIIHKDWKHHHGIVWIKECISIGLAILSAWGVTLIMKSYTQIPRPFIAYDDVVPLFTYGAYDSFPSGHATLFFALAISVYVYHKRLGKIFFICAFLISIARVMGGVHYPIDIIIGAIIGTGIGLIIHRAVSHFFRKNGVTQK
jgi:undecaprenyl-diphosphatase